MDHVHVSVQDELELPNTAWNEIVTTIATNWLKIVIYSMYLIVLGVEMNSGILVTRDWSWEGEFGTQDNESIYAVILGGLILRLRIQHKDSSLKCCTAIYIDALTTQQSKWDMLYAYRNCFTVSVWFRSLWVHLKHKIQSKGINIGK